MSESMWFYQERLLAIIRPRNFMQDELRISVLSYSIFISCSYAFFVLNFINSVLEKFRNSKLVLNHNFNLLRTSVTLFKNNRGSGFDISWAMHLNEHKLYWINGKYFVCKHTEFGEITVWCRVRENKYWYSLVGREQFAHKRVTCKTDHTYPCSCKCSWQPVDHYITYRAYILMLLMMYILYTSTVFFCVYYFMTVLAARLCSI
jgi:hypothetical protein